MYKTNTLKTLLKEMLKDLNKSKKIKMLRSCNGRLNIVKTARLPKLIYRFMHQNPSWFFCRNGYAVPKIHTELQGTLNTQNYLEKEEQSWSATLPHFQNLPQSSSSKTVVQAIRRNIQSSMSGIDLRVKKYVCLWSTRYLDHSVGKNSADISG